MATMTAFPAKPSGTPRTVIKARKSGFLADVWSVAIRALRALPREEVIIPSLIIPLFFFTVNIGALEDFAERGLQGLDFRAFSRRRSSSL